MKPAPPTSGKPRRGQTLVFMLMLMIILTFVAFSVYDTQHVVVQRVRTQIADDAAALTGARWQLASLNAIGEINLIKVTTDIVINGPKPFGDTEGNYAQYQPLFSALDKLQAKIAITGPMMGVLYGEQAAKLNGMHAIPDYASEFQFLAQFVQANAGDPSVLNDHWLDPPIFNRGNAADMQERQQLLLDYAALMLEIANQGMAAMPNIFPPDVVNAMDWSQASPYAEQYLPDPAFYAAIAGQDWCYLRQLLDIYSDWTFWGPVNRRYGISPFRVLNLQLTHQSDYTLWNNPATDQNNLSTKIQNQLGKRGLVPNQNWPGGDNMMPNGWPSPHGFHWTNDLPRFDTNNLTTYVAAPAYVQLNWAVYRPGWYNQWNATVEAQYLNSTVRDQYNYAYRYADSVWFSRAAASVTMAVPRYDQAHTSWTAASESAELSQDLDNLWQLRTANASSGTSQLQLSAGIQASSFARAFGSIDDSTPPTKCPVVLPVFTDVRLIPSVVSSWAGNLDIAFVEHVLFHLPPYTQHGVYAGGCAYCNDLKLWDSYAFRQIGRNWWISQAGNPNPCPVGGGGGSGIIAH